MRAVCSGDQPSVTRTAAYADTMQPWYRQHLPSASTPTSTLLSSFLHCSHPCLTSSHLHFTSPSHHFHLTSHHPHITLTFTLTSPSPHITLSSPSPLITFPSPHITLSSPSPNLTSPSHHLHLTSYHPHITSPSPHLHLTSPPHLTSPHITLTSPSPSPYTGIHLCCTLSPQAALTGQPVKGNLYWNKKVAYFKQTGFGFSRQTLEERRMKEKEESMDRSRQGVEDYKRM